MISDSTQFYDEENVGLLDTFFSTTQIDSTTINNNDSDVNLAITQHSLLLSYVDVDVDADVDENIEINPTIISDNGINLKIPQDGKEDDNHNADSYIGSNNQDCMTTNVVTKFNTLIESYHNISHNSDDDYNNNDDDEYKNVETIVSDNEINLAVTQYPLEDENEEDEIKEYDDDEHDDGNKDGSYIDRQLADPYANTTINHKHATSNIVVSVDVSYKEINTENGLMGINNDEYQKLEINENSVSDNNINLVISQPTLVDFYNDEEDDDISVAIDCDRTSLLVSNNVVNDDDNDHLNLAVTQHDINDDASDNGEDNNHDNEDDNDDDDKSKEEYENTKTTLGLTNNDDDNQFNEESNATPNIKSNNRSDHNSNLIESSEALRYNLIYRQ